MSSYSSRPVVVNKLQPFVFQRGGNRMLHLLLTAALIALNTGEAVCQDTTCPWAGVERILSRINPPLFPPREYVITSYGAQADGVTDCSEAISRAIQDCLRDGGGSVVVPQGSFLCGPIHLQSNVNLHLADGAVLKFSRDPERYLPVVFTRWEGVECMNYSPLIYAFEQENIAVTGDGTLDGQANDEFWWPWKGTQGQNEKEGKPDQKRGRDLLLSMGEKGIPVMQRTLGEGYCLRPNFVQLYRCRNVLIEGVRIINSPMWEIHPVLCVNVTIQNVRIDSHGPNNDGCNPESSKDVLIKDCVFNTGDDCIAIKSGRNNDGRRLNIPSENVVIQGCTFKDGHGGVTIGSEVSGGAWNIFAEDCDFESPVLYSALRIKSNAVRGGLIEHVYVRRFNVRLVGRAVVDIDLFYEEGKNGSYIPTVRNIGIEKMTVTSCKSAFNLVGYEEAPIRNIWFRDCRFENVTGGYVVKHVEGFSAVNTTINGRELEP